MERRLSAILAADVVGYSRLIRADEDGTITALQRLRAELIEPKIAAHKGRIVKLTGDTAPHSQYRLPRIMMAISLRCDWLLGVVRCRLSFAAISDPNFWNHRRTVS